MLPNGHFGGILCLVTVAAMVVPSTALAGPAGAAAGGIQGVILHSPVPADPAGLSRPVPGATVRAADVTSGQIYEGTRTDETGAYAVSGLPGGSYSLSIRTERGLFISDGVVDLRPGESKRVSFALRDEHGGEGQGEDEEGEDDGNKGSKDPTRKGFSWADHPWAAGGIVAGTAISLGVLANELTDEDKQQEKKASPSSP